MIAINPNTRPARLFVMAAFLLTSATTAGASTPLAGCHPVSLEKGETLDLTTYRGHLLYLDFWASWCPPCRQSFPFMNSLHKQLTADGLAILAVSLDENPTDARAFLEQVPAGFPIAIDTSGKCPELFGVEGMPTSYLIGRDGSILYRHTGFKPSDAAELRERIVKTLDHPE